MAIEIVDTNGQTHDFSLRNGILENECDGMVRVLDPRGSYLVHTDEAERCFALEPPQEPERPKFNSGVRQREVRNAETRLANARGHDPWEAATEEPEFWSRGQY